MGIQRNISQRDARRLELEHCAYRASKLARDHQVELLLDAGVDLQEAIAIVDGAAA